MRARTWLLVPLLIACLGGSALAKGPSIKMSVSPVEASLTDTVTVTVSIEIPGLTGPDRYWHPTFPLFTLVDSQIKRGTQTRVDPRKGQQLYWVEMYRYILKPKDNGRLQIGPARMRIGSNEYETRDVGVRVRIKGSMEGTTTAGIGETDAAQLQAPGYVPPKLSEASDVFLYAVTDKASVWVGEQVTVSWLLFSRFEILRSEPKPPLLDGVWSEVLYEPETFYQYSDARIGRRDFQVALIAKRAVFPLNPGKLVIAPFQARVATVRSEPGRSERISSEALEVEVRALPKGAPSGFDASYIGSFSVDASVDRDLLQAGQSMMLTLRVRARGPIRRTTAPHLSFEGFSFERSGTFEETIDNEGDLVAGERLYSYWTTPKAGGELSLPPIELPYFNPESGEYETARTRAIGLTVTGDPELESALKRRLEAAGLPGREIKLLRTSSRVESRSLTAPYLELWFWILALVPGAVFFIVLMIEKLRRRMQRETIGVRLRRARGIARRHYKIAEIHLRGNRPSKFFSELSYAIYGFLEEWLGQSLKSLTLGEMREVLEARGLEARRVKQLVDDLESFDFARFAPSAAGPGEMRSALRKTKELLSGLSRTKPTEIGEAK